MSWNSHRAGHTQKPLTSQRLELFNSWIYNHCKLTVTVVASNGSWDTGIPRRAPRAMENPFGETMCASGTLRWGAIWFNAIKLSYLEIQYVHVIKSVIKALHLIKIISCWQMSMYSTMSCKCERVTIFKVHTHTQTVHLSWLQQCR